MNRVVVATCDTLTPRMAGPAIRAWQMAIALAAEHEVQLVTTAEAALSHPGFDVRSVDGGGLADLERWCDVLVFQGWVIHGRPFLVSSDKVLVADVYDPLHLEQLEQGRDDGPRGRLFAVESATAVLNEQLLRADFVLCASENQRDFWLGHLASLGRVNPPVYDEDETLRSLIDVAPFGIPETPPEHTRPAIKGVVPGIGPDDRVILWGGGIYNWFDPLTVIRAVDGLRHRLPEVRLVFMGVRHPNPEIPTMSMATEARRLSDRLQLTGRHVFFNDGWVPYEERQNHLLEADVGVSAHLACVEAELSYRTRILDYLWAALPVVTTSGDAVARLVDDRGLGLTVRPGDVRALEGALLRALTDTELRASFRNHVETVQSELTWPRALEPLVRFCRSPRRAPDVTGADSAPRMRKVADVPHRWLGWRHDVRAGRDYLRTGGAGLVTRKAIGRLRRVLSPGP
jgi:glycosyltransferase involved in cell wall biosynthesis